MGFSSGMVFSRVSSWDNGVLRLLHCMRSFVHGIAFVEWKVPWYMVSPCIFLTVPFPVARVASFHHWFAVPGSRLPRNRFKRAWKTRIRAGSLGRCGGGSCGLCGSRVHWFVFGGIFRRLPCVHGVHGVHQSPWNAAEERRRGRNGGTTFRLDSLGTLVYGVNIFLLIEIFTL